MADARKSDEALKKIQDIKRRVDGHEANIARFERDKADRIRDFDQRIKQEKDQIKQYLRHIDELKRQI